MNVVSQRQVRSNADVPPPERKKGGAEPRTVFRRQRGARWLILGLALLVSIAIRLVTSSDTRPHIVAGVKGRSQPVATAPITPLSDGVRVPRATPLRSTQAATGVSGVVRSRSGEELARATVCWLAGNEGFYGPDSCTTTDRSGRFEFAIRPGEASGVVASASGYRSKRLTLGVEPEASRPLAIVLDPGGEGVSGRVLDASGGVLAGALVSVRASDQTVIAAASSDSDGNFRLDVPPGLLEVRAELAAYAPAARAVQAPSRGIEMSLSPASTITGRVIDRATERAIPGAQVTASQQGLTASLPRQVQSEPDGRFELHDVAVGTYSLVAVAPRWRGRSEPLHVGLGERTEVVIRADAAVTLAGRLELDGKACGEGFAMADGPLRETRHVQSDGSVVFDGLLPGRYLVSFACTRQPSSGHAAAGQELASEREMVGGEEFLTIATEPVVRVWRLTSARERAAEGQASATLRVSIHAPERFPVSFSAFVGKRNSDTPIRGRWQGSTLVFEPLELGEYRVYLEQMPAIQKQVRLEREHQIADVELEAPTTLAAISGRVLDGAGDPVPDVWVRAYHSQYPFSSVAAAGEPILTDVEGNFRIANLFEGSYRIVATGPTGTAHLADVRAGGDEVALRLTGGEASALLP
jgi:hypothetical protein